MIKVRRPGGGERGEAARARRGRGRPGAEKEEGLRPRPAGSASGAPGSARVRAAWERRGARPTHPRRREGVRAGEQRCPPAALAGPGAGGRGVGVGADNGRDAGARGAPGRPAGWGVAACCDQGNAEIQSRQAFFFCMELAFLFF